MSGPLDGLRWVSVQLGELPDTPVYWLWRRYVARGYLHLLEGEEGIGKGYLCAWVAVQVASGRWYGEPRTVVWFTSEETGTKIQARLLQAGYKPGVHAPVHHLQLNKGLMTLPKFEDYLIARLKKYQPAIGMVVADPLRDHCAPTEDMGIRYRSNNDEAWIRPACQSWERVAEMTDAFILGLHHRNKSSEGTARQKSTGSGAWRQVCRQVLVMSKVSSQRAFAVDKTNLGPEDKEPQVYELETQVIGRDHNGDEVTEAVFRVGDLTGCEDINVWEREARKAADIDPSELMEVWLEEQIKQGNLQYGAYWKPEFVERGMGLTPRKTAETLRKLRTQGVVNFRPRHGWLVPKPSTKD